MDVGMRAVLGTFDGVHIGHRALFYAAKRAGERDFLPVCAVVITRGSSRICSDAERDRRLLAAGADRIITFSLDEVRGLSCDEFGSLLRVLGVRACVCGENFTFGYGRAGNAQTLSSLFPTETVQSVMYDSLPVSSTRIRESVESGDVTRAARLLGTPFSYEGKVRHGRAIGHTMGFPTANISIDEKTVCPADGVYTARVKTGRRAYPALVNVGSRPTVGGHERRIECYLDGFSGDLYGKSVKIYFLRYLRAEKHFSSTEELKRQIESDMNSLKCN